MGTAPRSHFYKLLVSSVAGKPGAPSYYVLDNGVVSRIASIPQTGLKPRDPQATRVSNLLRAIVADDIEFISCRVAILEGSGFARGALNRYDLYRRIMSVRAVCSRDEQELDAILASDGFIIGTSDPQGMEAEIDFWEKEVRESILPMLGSNYAASLCLAQVVQDGLDGRAAGISFERTFKELGHVPSIASMTALLSLYGTHGLRSRLRDKLFKLSAANLRSSLLSAAFDLTYYSDAFTLGLQAKATQFPAGVRPYLVTDDNMIFELHGVLDSSITGAAPPQKSVDAKLVGELAMTQLRMHAVRVLRKEPPHLPSLSVVRTVCRPMEEALGLQPLRWDVFSRPTAANKQPDWKGWAAIGDQINRPPNEILATIHSRGTEGPLFIYVAELAVFATQWMAGQRGMTVSDLIDRTLPPLLEKMGAYGSRWEPWLQAYLALADSKFWLAHSALDQLAQQDARENARGDRVSYPAACGALILVLQTVLEANPSSVPLDAAGKIFARMCRSQEAEPSTPSLRGTARPEVPGLLIQSASRNGPWARLPHYSTNGQCSRS